MAKKMYVARTTQEADFNKLYGPVNSLVGNCAWLGPDRKIIFHADEQQLAAMKELPEIVEVMEKGV